MPLYFATPSSCPILISQDFCATNFYFFFLPVFVSLCQDLQPKHSSIEIGRLRVSLGVKVPEWKLIELYWLESAHKTFELKKGHK